MSAVIAIQNPKTEIQNPTIHILPADVTSRIAAGEVIERPASVLKELLENALDAQAKRISCEISGGGVDLVRVSDDGSGMSRPDLELCTLPHATSKIKKAEELENLSTMGFRGEALPSIASVSHFSIVSRHKAGGEDQAWRIDISCGSPAQPEAKPAAGAFGTSVEARDLFFNLPARKKFLKGLASEAAACTDTFLRAALTRPDVSFALFQDRREVFSVQAHTDCGLRIADCGLNETANPQSAIHNPQWVNACLSRARAVLGKANSEGLLELFCDHSTLPDIPPGYRLFGLISPPAKTRPNRAGIYLTINSRAVKDRTLTSALLEACRHLLPPKRYPLAVLYLELPNCDVDINVHPTKQEVRFRIPGLVYSLFHHAIRSSIAPHPTENSAIADSSEMSQPTIAKVPAKPAAPVVPLGAPKPDYGQRSLDLWPTVAPQVPTSAKAAEAPAQYRPVSKPPLEVVQSKIQNPKSKIEHAAFRVLGQAGGSYIVIEDDAGVKLIDQHALHERVLFETLLERSRALSSGERQGLLTPEIIELTPVQESVFHQDQQARELLSTLGFDVEAFGPHALAVRSIPAIFSSAAKAALVTEVLDAFSDSPDSNPALKKFDRAALREKAVYMLSCKGAIKAGERLTTEQMASLVEQYRRYAGTAAFTCPHGRPVAKELSWEDLERAVGRR